MEEGGLTVILRGAKLCSSFKAQKKSQDDGAKLNSPCFGRVTARLPRALSPSASSRLPTRATTMDIDDLLQEFDDNSVPAGTRDINDLTQAWIAERTAPEILPFQNDLLERLMDRVRQQV